MFKNHQMIAAPVDPAPAPVILPLATAPAAASPVDGKSHARPKKVKKVPTEPLRLPCNVFVYNGGCKVPGQLKYVDSLKGDKFFTYRGLKLSSASVFVFPDPESGKDRVFTKATSVYKDIRGETTGKGAAFIYIANESGGYDFTMKDYCDSHGFVNSGEITRQERDRLCTIASEAYVKKKFVTILDKVDQHIEQKEKSKSAKKTRTQAGKTGNTRRQSKRKREPVAKAAQDATPTSSTIDAIDMACAIVLMARKVQARPDAGVEESEDKFIDKCRAIAEKCQQRLTHHSDMYEQLSDATSEHALALAILLMVHRETQSGQVAQLGQVQNMCQLATMYSERLSTNQPLPNN